MTYNQSKQIASETEVVDPAKFDALMEKARQVRADSCRKIFAAMVEGRQKEKERLQNVKVSLYT